MDLGPLIPLLSIWLIVGVVLTVIDIREHRLPNALTLPMLVVTPVGLVLAGLLGDVPSSPWMGWSGAGLGAVLWLGVLGLIWLISGGRAMGMGDVKLGPSLGATLGWVSVETALVGLVLSFILGGVVSAGLLMTKRVHRRTAIPFGPFLFFGSVIAVVANLRAA